MGTGIMVLEGTADSTGTIITSVGTSVDPVTKTKLFQRLNLEQNITIVFVTHNPETSDYCERVVRIRDGHIESDERRPPTAGIHRTRHELESAQAREVELSGA